MATNFFTSAENLSNIKKEINDSEKGTDRKELISKLEQKTIEYTEEDIQKKFRIIFSICVVVVFFLLNFFIVYLIHNAFQFDMIRISENSKYERLIDTKVLITLITGILLETAIAFGLLAKFVFNIDKSKK